MKSSTNTLSHLVLSTESATKEKVQINVVPRARRSMRNSKNVENAIYAYIRAIRTLGRTTMNTLEIADALNLPLAQVEQSIHRLKKKGVKVLNAA